MQKMRVVAAQGMTLRGEMKIRLNKKQLARRPELKASNKGDVKLDGSQVVNLKYGEEFWIDGLGKVGRDLLEPVDKPQPEENALVDAEKAVTAAQAALDAIEDTDEHADARAEAQAALDAAQAQLDQLKQKAGAG